MYYSFWRQLVLGFAGQECETADDRKTNKEVLGELFRKLGLTVVIGYIQPIIQENIYVVHALKYLKLGYFMLLYQVSIANKF